MRVTRSNNTKKQRSDGGTVLACVVIRDTCMYFSLPKMDTRAELELEKPRPLRRPEIGNVYLYVILKGQIGTRPSI